MIGAPGVRTGRAGDWLEQGPDGHFAGLQFYLVWAGPPGDWPEVPEPSSQWVSTPKGLECLWLPGKGRMTFAFLTRPHHLLFPRVSPPLPSGG